MPDSQKDYVLLLNAHPAEPCGQEGSPRFLEDLLIWRETEPGHVLDDATGLHDKPHKISVAELLRRVKIYFVSPSPDGWAGGDGPGPGEQRQRRRLQLQPHRLPGRLGVPGDARSCSTAATRR